MRHCLASLRLISFAKDNGHDLKTVGGAERTARGIGKGREEGSSCDHFGGKCVEFFQPLFLSCVVVAVWSTVRYRISLGVLSMFLSSCRLPCPFCVNYIYIAMDMKLDEDVDKSYSSR